MRHGRFIELLDHDYILEAGNCEDHYSKSEYLSQIIFQFNTSDTAIDILFATKMVEVLTVIRSNSWMKYIKEENQYINYLTMVNMPFLENKLDYGTSIRSAWFNDYEEYSIYGDRFKIAKQELTVFIDDLLYWYSL